MLDDQEASSNEPTAEGLLPFYVYELRDPRDQSVFYVGKGKGLRVITAHSPEEENAKGERIREIRKAGLIEHRTIVGRFETEEEAFAVESILIKWVYGFSNLTNKIHGHRQKFVRDFRYKGTPENDAIEGIDIPRRLSTIRDGSYTDNQRHQILNNGIVEKLESIRDYLKNQPRFGRLSISEPDLSRPQDPCLRIEGFSEFVVMSVKMQLTGKAVVIGLIPVGGKKEQITLYRLAVTGIREPFALKREPSPYALISDYKTKQNGFPGGIPIDRLDVVSDHILSALERLEDRI